MYNTRYFYHKDVICLPFVSGEKNKIKKKDNRNNNDDNMIASNGTRTHGRQNQDEPTELWGQPIYVPSHALWSILLLRGLKI